MATHTIQFGERTDVRGLTRYIQETTDITIDYHGRTIEFGQTTHDRLSALPSDSDGHIDPNGDLWLSGHPYPIGLV